MRKARVPSRVHRPAPRPYSVSLAMASENHKMMLDHYQQTKNLLVSYSPKALGFF